MKLFVILTLFFFQVTGSPFFGLNGPLLFTPSIDIQTAAKDVATVCGQIVTSVNSFNNALPTTSDLLNNVSISFYDYFYGTYTSAQIYLTTISNAATDRKTSSITIFKNINDAITNTLNNMTSNENSTLLSFLSNFTNVTGVDMANIESVSSAINTINPLIISIGQNTAPGSLITAQTIYYTLPSSQVSSFVNLLKNYKIMEQQTAIYVTSNARMLSLAGTKITEYVTKTTIAYTTIDSTTSNFYSSASNSISTYSSSFTSKLAAIFSDISSLNATLSKFDDIYIGSSTDSYTSSASTLYSQYLSSFSSHISSVATIIETFRDNILDNYYQNLESALSTGYNTVTNMTFSMFQKSTGETCVNKYVSTFTTYYTSLFNNYTNCLSESSTAFSTNLLKPSTILNQTNRMILIQKDIQYYTTTLNSILSGVAVYSSADVRILTDSKLSGLLTQTKNITDTFSQQFQNSYSQIEAEFDLMASRVNICLVTQNIGVQASATDALNVFNSC